jgi:hypothetical protein
MVLGLVGNAPFHNMYVLVLPVAFGPHNLRYQIHRFPEPRVGFTPVVDFGIGQFYILVNFVSVNLALFKKPEHQSLDPLWLFSVFTEQVTEVSLLVIIRV